MAGRVCTYPCQYCERYVQCTCTYTSTCDLPTTGKQQVSRAAEGLNMVWLQLRCLLVTLECTATGTIYMYMYMFVLKHPTTTIIGYACTVYMQSRTHALYMYMYMEYVHVVHLYTCTWSMYVVCTCICRHVRGDVHCTCTCIYT